MCISGGFYGLTLNAKFMSGNIFINFLYLSLVDIAANILIIVLAKFVPRRFLLRFRGHRADWSWDLVPVPYERPLLSGLLFLGGISCILITAIPEHSNIVSFAGKFFISGAYSISYLVSAEIFPTTIRNAGLGLCSVMARVGSILCPYVLITKGLIYDANSKIYTVYNTYHFV